MVHREHKGTSLISQIKTNDSLEVSNMKQRKTIKIHFRVQQNC